MERDGCTIARRIRGILKSDAGVLFVALLASVVFVLGVYWPVVRLLLAD